MNQPTSQEEVRRIIISNMVKKWGSIVPFIGEDTIASYSYGVPLVPFWLSYRALKWIRSTLEEGLMTMRIYTLFTNIGSSAYEASLVAPRTYVHEAMKPC